MVVKVIIPTYNASSFLEKQLEMLNSQTLKPKEILVIDSSSTDNTQKIALRNGARLVVIRKEEFSHGRTRNMAVGILGKTDIVMFMSQDAVPRDNLLIEKLVSVLSDNVVASYARHIPREDAKPTERVFRFFNYPEESMIKDSSTSSRLGVRTFLFSNVCSAIKYEVFEKVGGFPEDVAVAEDMVFAAKLIKNGYRIAYVPSAAVYHSHNFGPLYYFRRYFDLGRSLKNHYWIISNNHMEEQGRKLLKEQLKFIFKEKKNPLWLPYWFIENFLKFIGFYIGLKSEKLPRSLVDKISLYPNSPGESLTVFN